MKNENGNALVLILVAIVLLGGLTAMLARSSGTSDDTGSFEQQTIKATKLLRYASGIETAVKNLLARGCSENELSFWHDTDGNGTEDGSDLYYNANAPTDRSCHVFEPEGAGVRYLSTTELGIQGVAFIGRTDMDGVGVSNCGDTSCSELYITMYHDGEEYRSLCEGINRVLKHNDLIPLPNTTYMFATPAFTGTFGAYHYASNASFTGKENACFRYSPDPEGDGFYSYYVLLAR